MSRSRNNLLYGLYIIVVAALALIIFLAINSSSPASTKHKTTPKRPSLAKSVPNPTATSSKPKTTSNPSSSSTASKPSQTAPQAASSTNSASTSSSSSANNQATLTNTGPGDEVGLFAAISLISGLMYYAFTVFRLKNTSIR